MHVPALSQRIAGPQRIALAHESEEWTIFGRKPHPAGAETLGVEGRQMQQMQGSQRASRAGSTGGPPTVPSAEPRPKLPSARTWLVLLAIVAVNYVVMRVLV